MESKLKHLEFIQNIVTRMASNSFLLKGWMITIVSALIAVSVDKENICYLGIAYFPILIFWFLDAYFLKQERLFRHLYNEVRKKDDDEIDFGMPIKNEKENYCEVLFSITLSLFYIGSIATITLIYFFI